MYKRNGGVKMIYDFIELNKSKGSPLYLQLYTTIKKSIENGNLSYDSKLPSIRKLSEDLSLSRTTIENAYNQLCAEGYIRNVPQKGYYVQATVHKIAPDKSTIGKIGLQDTFKAPIKYDFTGKSVDIDNINLKIWKRYIRNVLNCEYLITAYGHPQGEEELRIALSKYSYSVRGVCGKPENIVIGAGTQPLLYLICGLVRDYGDTIAMETVGFNHAQQVFEDCGLSIVKIDSDDNGITPQSLKDSGARILLVNPSGNLTTGKTLKMNRRMDIIKWANENNGIIIEDDYNGELRYSTHPIPAMQGYSNDRVIYMGSFSKLLLPSVRISYMTLPQNLVDKYKINMSRYNQTASKIEQLALARYIKDGSLEKHLRKLRKIYSEKSVIMSNTLKKQFGDSADIYLLETSLAFNIVLNKKTDINHLYNKLVQQGIKIIKNKSKENSFDLSFSGIPVQNISTAITIIKNTVDTINRV